MSRKPFLTRLALRNFRSIRNEVVAFNNPLILVGRNGAGKTNLVTALAFLADCMDRPLRSVMETWGGLGSIGSIDTPLDDPYIRLRADFTLPNKVKTHGHYSLSLEVTKEGDFIVAHEQCQVLRREESPTWFERRGDHFSCSVAGISLSPDAQSLAMPILGAVDVFAAAAQAIGSMRVYEIDPGRVGTPYGSSSSRILERDGANTAAVINSLANRGGLSATRLGQLLSAVAPNIVEVWPSKLLNGNFILEFVQSRHADVPTHFPASAMSNGTLRALGLIVALMQDPAPSLIALEEPEAVIHPGALGAITDLIESASQRTQILVTTHSPELLDKKWIKPENLRIVEWVDGVTHISGLGNAPVRSLQRHLIGAGELLRANALDAAVYDEHVKSSDFFDRIAA